MSLTKSTLLNNIFKMSMGTAFAQIINVVAQPVLTRIIPPEKLGIYTFLISLATIIIPIASLKLDMLIVSEKDDDTAQYITDVSIILTFLISLISLIVISIFYNASFSNPFNKYGPIIFIVPLLIFTNGIRFLFISYNNRYKEYSLIAKIAIMREGARAIFQIVYGLISPTVFGQALGYAIAPIFGFRYQTKVYFKKRKQRSNLDFVKLKKILVLGKQQVLFLAPSQLINSFSASLITIFISILYSAKQLGYYSAGVRILLVPIVLIAANVSKVIYKEISERVSDQQAVLKTLIKMIVMISSISVIGFGVLYAIAPVFSRIVFGVGYEVAGQYIRCLIIMYTSRLIATSFSGIYTVFKKQQYELLLNIIVIILATGCFVYSKLVSAPIEIFLKMISVSYGLMYALMLSGYILFCKKYEYNLKVTKNV